MVKTMTNHDTDGALRTGGKRDCAPRLMAREPSRQSLRPAFEGQIITNTEGIRGRSPSDTFS